jgi:hypothetical protein
MMGRPKVSLSLYFKMFLIAMKCKTKYLVVGTSVDKLIPKFKKGLPNVLYRGLESTEGIGKGEMLTVLYGSKWDAFKGMFKLMFS